MKTILSQLGRRTFLIAFAGALMIAAAPAADDINTLFQQGRTAYYNGNFELASQLLTQVLAANPGHFETKAILAQIKVQSKGHSSLQKQYSAVIIPKFQVTDVTLAESLEALGIFAKNASNGKVQPNFVVRTPELNSARITLSLTDVPLTEVIRYLAEMSKARTTWDQHAVMFSGVAD